MKRNTISGSRTIKRKWNKTLRFKKKAVEKRIVKNNKNKEIGFKCRI